MIWLSIAKFFGGVWNAFWSLPSGVKVAIVGTIAGALLLIGVNNRAYDRGAADMKAAYEAASQKAKDAATLKANKAAADLEKDNADADKQAKTRDNIIVKIVDRPVYRDRCFDDDGLSVANSALLGAPVNLSLTDKPVP